MVRHLQRLLSRHIGWAQAHETLLAGALVGLVLLWAISRAHKPRRDPQRLFSASQTREGRARAGGRCEASRWGLWRCTAPAQHGDHWYPHSRGGATSMDNYVALCAPHNLRKSATVPTWWATTMLAHRRRSYFPAGVRRRPGAKYRGEQTR